MSGASPCVPGRSPGARLERLVCLGMLVGALGCASAATVGTGGDEDGGRGDGSRPDRQQDAPPFVLDGPPAGDAGGAVDAPGLDAAGDDGAPPDVAPPQEDAAPEDAGQEDAATCTPEADESQGGNDCATAIDKGSLTDLASSHLAILGNLWPDGDVDWYRVNFVDSPDDAGGCDKLNVRISFTQNPGNGYRFDVVLADCVSAPSCGAGEVATGLTDFEWNDAGECPCVVNPAGTSDGVHVCVDHSMALRLRVYRAAGAVACENYELSLDNG